MQEYERLIIIPDDALHYVSFEALVTRRVAGTTTRPPFLLMRHRVSYAPSASVLALLKAGKSTAKARSRLEVLAYGDPVFSRKQLATQPKESNNSAVRIMQDAYQERGLNLEPLPNTSREVNGIIAQYPKSAGKAVLGLEAKESGFKDESLDRYRCPHLATHGFIDEEVPARSGVVFSLVGETEEDGILQMNDIFNLNLNADLTVLSACQTGFGRLVRGEGIVGLTRAFLYAGSSSVAVSLWNVQDYSTADFMKKFYKNLRTGKSKAEALRRAKISMLYSDRPLYRHPYYWAGFVLVGRG